MATIKEYLDYAELAQAAYGNFSLGKPSVSELINGDAGFSSATQADYFSKRYKILATSQQYGIGNINSMEAILFEEIMTGKKVMAIRGSQEVVDYIVDVQELTLNGNIMSQTTSLENFYNALISDNKITTTEHLDVTGHSLGGFLAQNFTAHHANIVDEAYTYNAPGYGGIRAEILNALGIINYNLSSNKIINIYAKEGWNMTAGLGVLFGDTLAISIDGAEGPNLLNHKMGRLTESLHIYDMLSFIVNTQDLGLLTSIVEHSTNEQVLKVVKGVFEDTKISDGIELAIHLKNSYFMRANGLIDLYPKSASSIATQAKGDKAILYALTKLNPFAIEGNLPAYVDIDPTHYSEKYLQDRAQYLYYLLDEKHRYDIDPTLSMNHFEDSGLGSDYTLKQSFSRSQILFEAKNVRSVA